MRRRLLEFQADRIEAVLARHKVPARVTGGSVAPRWIQFQVLPALGARVSKVKSLADELAMALDCDTCRVSRQGGLLLVQIPRTDPQPVRLLALQRRLLQSWHSTAPSRGAQRDRSGPTRRGRPIPFGAAVLGLAEDGAPLLVRLPSPQVAHILISGTTGSGKSALAQTIVASLALNHRPSQMGFVLIDPKRRSFSPLTGLPHLLHPVLVDPDEISRVLGTLVQLMLRRDREERRPVSSGSSGETRVVVVIDELADLLMMTGKDAQEAITRLSQRGRQAGIHVIACTQKPASKVMGGLAKANFPVRLVGRVTSPEDAKVASGYAGTGAERLHAPGDFISVSGGHIRRFQAAYVSPQELAEVVEHMLKTGPVRGNRGSTGWADVSAVHQVSRSAEGRVDRLQRGFAGQFLDREPLRRLTDGVRHQFRQAAFAESL